MAKEKTEKQIEKEILDYLNKEIGFFFKHQSVGIYDPTIEKYRSKSMYDLNGVADILGLLKKDRVGRFVAIEVKKPGEHLRMNQLGFLEKVLREGGIAFKASSVEEVKEKLHNFGVFV